MLILISFQQEGNREQERRTTCSLFPENFIRVFFYQNLDIAPTFRTESILPPLTASILPLCMKKL